MSRCENIQKELEAFLSDDLDDTQKNEIQKHLNECQKCSQAFNKSTRLSEVLHRWQDAKPPAVMFDRLKRRLESTPPQNVMFLTNYSARKMAFEMVKVAAVVLITLLVSDWFQESTPEVPDESTTINFYLHEHQSVVPQTVSTDLTPSEPARMHVNRDDLLYYEFFDHRPEYARPGIIMRGPVSQPKITSPEAPAISNGHILTRKQAREVLGTELKAPARIHPGYILDKIRKIEGRNSLQLLYTDGINTISLFEQSLQGEQRLAVQDFREYAVYQTKGQSGGMILAWSDDVLSYVLIGTSEMSRLMDMAQSISATNRREKP
jgi:hypothetical protein